MKFTFPPETRVLDGYTLKRAIHRGGFGEVYYALSDAGREVALKLLQNNSEVELRGVQQCLNLSHPNLVTIFDVRQDGEGDHWIIMEYIGGETLDAAIRRHPQGMPMEQIRKWLPGITAGVAYLHSRGLVHRDLKPANVFSDGGVVKVGDVGLSKFITPSRRSAHTQSVGTVYYMAPEVAKGRYGKEVDVYALGVILYEMLTGHVPFDGESTAEILMKHLTTTPDLSKLPPRLQRVIGQALAKEPARRFASMEEFAKAFDDAVLGKSVPDAPPPAPSAVRSEQSDLTITLPGTAPAVQPVPFAATERPVLSSRRRWLTMAAVALGCLLLTRSVRLGLFEFAVFTAAAIYGTHRYLTRHPLQPSTAPAAPPAAPRRITPAATPAYQPLTQTPLGLRSRAAHWLTTAVLSTGICGGLLAGTVLIAPSLFGFVAGTPFSAAGAGPQPDVIALFAATTIIAAWLASLAVKLTEGRLRVEDGRSDDSQRRLALVLAGLVTGAAAWGIERFLQLDAGQVFAPGEFDGAFSALGERSLVDAIDGRLTPSLLGYMVFFAGLFGLRSWWRQIDLCRESRFRVASVLMTVVVAWLWSALFTFPQTWAILWAAVISSTVQLAAPWSPTPPVTTGPRGRS